MKKITILFSLLLITATYSSAQTEVTSASSTSKNVRLGVSISSPVSWLKVTSNNGTHEGTRFSINYGLMFDRRIAGDDNYAFSTGLYMNNLGGEIEHDYAVKAEDGSIAPFSQSRRNIKYKLSYVNIPITLKLKSNQIGYMTYFARVGFDLGFNIGARADYTEYYNLPVNNVETQEFEDINFSDKTQLFRTSLHIEGGVEYNIAGSTNILLSLEWNNGLNNVFSKDNEVRFVENEVVDLERIEAVSNYIALTLGVFF